MTTTVHLYPHAFSELERVMLETVDFRASTFTYPSGVQAVRLENAVGHLLMLPFQGQQIWDAVFHGRSLKMKSMFGDPRLTRNYLENYGGLLLHCGITAMGVPTAADAHLLHGELPNAPYGSAYLHLGEDDRGIYLALGGTYQHTVAFAHNYRARPEVRLYADSSEVAVRLEIENLKHSPMELMYLAHLNWRPIDEATLCYSAVVSPETVRIRRTLPSHAQFSPEALQQLEDFGQHPELHNTLKTGVMYDPEMVFIVDYRADQHGWSHSLQIHPDGSSDYVRHRPTQLPVGVRWLTRTADQDALGLVLPATAEPNGYSTEKAAGRVVSVPPTATWTCDYSFAALEPERTNEVKALIDSTLEVYSSVESAIC